MLQYSNELERLTRKTYNHIQQNVYQLHNRMQSTKSNNKLHSEGFDPQKNYIPLMSETGD